ncbi:MAG: ABC transporter ATP-binding protein [Armatimonadetes bacterium]|nr:ABC transporter ATP-binding protein [Armatimonadota bacterium]
MLTIERLKSGYGKKQVLFDVSLDVKEREIVAIIGPNGCGKSTLLKTICGVIPAWKGDIDFNGHRINNATPAQNVCRGITFAPQGSRVFDELSVAENLEIGGFHLSEKQRRSRTDEILQLFPVLERRLQQEAGRLSGGEQQMLALARVLIPSPKLLMLDEPSLGLAPGLVEEIFAKIAEINSQTGVSILIVEQRVRAVLALSHRVCSLKLGKVALFGNAAELGEDSEKLKQLFL